MPYIDEDTFNEHMRGLLVARGGYTSEKKKEEIKRYWFLEFRSCDEAAFIQVMGRLKFAGKSGDGFPSYRDFREEYNQIIKPQAQAEARKTCGLCRSGRVFFRDVLAMEVRDLVKWCALCRKDALGDLGWINPKDLHSDLLGQLRTPAALIEDRSNGDLRPINDPEAREVLPNVPY